MTRRWLSQPDTSYEPLQGAYPDAVLDEHPSGEFVAMQVTVALDVLQERAAVWNTKTRELVWKAEDLNAICWSSRGDEVYVVRQSYHRSVDHPARIVTPLQSEVSYFFQRHSWPGRQLTACSSIRPPTGWIVDVAVSPIGDLACFSWNDQTEARVELVSIVGNEVPQRPGQG